MKATPLIINWHDDNAPIYSAHFEPHGKGRLATAAGDNNVRLWKIEGEGEERKVEYLSTLSKHSQAVNVVRWAPKSELLASAGDDGNVILWVPAEHHLPSTFGSDNNDDKETWRTKHMCRASDAEIYDLSWSPDGMHFIIGSMDNIARIYSAGKGTLVRQIAEHGHYVQGVSWDPLNEFIATQSSDRSVHIYSLKTKDGQYTLNNHHDKPPRIATHSRADLPQRRITSDSPAPPEPGYRVVFGGLDAAPSVAVGSSVPSAPGTPTSMFPMNPPSAISHSRRSSLSSRRSVSPAPSMPLPAVMPMESPKLHTPSTSLSLKNASLYANETLTSFFRRLTFTPDGSLLLTPAGQYQNQFQTESGKTTYEVINTVYIYTRGGINRSPIAHLPGHKKPSIAVRCSPIFYTLRQGPLQTKNITIDTSSAEESMPSLPEPLPSIESTPLTGGSTNTSDVSLGPTTVLSVGPKPPFSLPYRMVYAVATQDSVLLYDTQQHTPICIVSNLHCATFTDLTWSSDGLTLLITSSDGFCSTLSFLPSALGEVYTGVVGPLKGGNNNAGHTTPIPAPNPVLAPPSPYQSDGHQHHTSTSSIAAPSPPPTAIFVGSARPSSPARSNSASSVMTQASTVLTNPPLIAGAVPSITAAKSGKVTGVPITTPPPETLGLLGSVSGTEATVAAGRKRESIGEKNADGKEGTKSKRRRIAPTLVNEGA